ncbi:Monocarboxylate transporter 5 like protein [Argiope bruennichi]|uniref:Monocarboxylate transporter 5 like protein n=1 Tax=Argiope bruennichi TaxID=94029 RepID=A0A8T0EZY9_ARGBR|nr:Monocarboxylate transporter 5 like protein [Argiope bruennichi]
MASVPATGMDGGYAWVVAIACFMINFIMAGLARAAGVLYVAVIELYGVSREAATTPFSMRFSVRNMSGPLVGILGQRFGIRATVLMGGLLAGVGGILCVLAPNVFWITMSWGGVHGLGYGLCNIIHVLLLNQYFDKYKGTAMGFAFSGDCFGTFAFPVILEILLEEYGLNGTFLILGGIALNVIPAAMLLKTPYWLAEKRKTVTLDPESKQGKLYTVEPSKALNSLTEMPSFEVHHKSSVSHFPITKENVTLVRTSCVSNDNHGFVWNENFKDSELPQPEMSLRFIRAMADPKKPELVLNLENFTNHCDEKYKIRSYSCKLPNLMTEEHLLGERAHQNIIIAEALKLENSSSDILENKCAITQDLASNSEQKLNTVDDAEDAEIQRNAFLRFISTNTRPLFILIAITMSFFVFLFIAIITIINDYATDIGIASDLAKYIIIGFSVSDLIGRLGFGVVLDKKWIKLGHFAGLTTVIMGASILIIPFFANFYYLMSCMFVCGFVLGGNCIMYPILVTHYVDKKDESVALGCLQFYGGVLVLPLPPMIGFFRDSIGSYNGVFWTVGGLCIASGLAWVLEPCLWRKQQSTAKSSALQQNC